MTTSLKLQTCATADCTLRTVGKSKYCANHRAAARDAWRDRIAQQEADKAEREARFQLLHDFAMAAGQVAAEAAQPPTMVVYSPVSLFDDSPDVTKPVFVEPEGPCGFAWTVVRPGTSSFARWLVRKNLASKHYSGGVQVWVRGYGQSLARKEAHADAYAAYLAEHLGTDSLRIYSQSRMD